MRCVPWFVDKQFLHKKGYTEKEHLLKQLNKHIVTKWKITTVWLPFSLSGWFSLFYITYGKKDSVRTAIIVIVE